MHLRAFKTSQSLRRHVLTILVPLVFGGAGANFACAADSKRPENANLRSEFPQKAAQILDVGQAFVLTNHGFAAPMTRSASAGFVMNLPAMAENGIIINTREGREIVVRERGIAGAGKKDSNAIVYGREGGSSYWTANDAGYEEWLLLDEMATVGNGPVAVWDIEGADLRQDGARVDLVDSNGEIRVSVTAPAAFARDGRGVPVRLVASGQTISLFADIEGETLLVDPIWTSPPSMITARCNHTATLLPNGKVLFAGGSLNGPNPWNAVEIYDPATNSFAAAAPMNDSRQYHTATLLQDGRVLVAGGSTSNNISLKDAEIYDPATNTWTNTPRMNFTHHRHAADILPNGQVVVVGGDSSFGTSSQLERYDPVANTWLLAGDLTQGRADLGATTLPNGKLFVTGGVAASATYVDKVDLCDPMMSICTAYPVMDTTRALHTVSLLDSGKIMVTGGLDNVQNRIASTQIFDFATNQWQSGPNLSVARGLHSAARLPSGMILVAGGYLGNAMASAGAEIFNPMTNTWSVTVSMLGTRYRHTATTLPNGKVLVAGGSNGSTVTATTQLFDFREANGSFCTSNDNCTSGFCVDAVCCDTACNDGPCKACAVATGASANGTCTPRTGNICNDGDACTQTDTCQAGVCTGANPVTCMEMDQCHDVGVCDTMTGLCSNPVKTDGSSCDDGNACTPMDICQGGVCTAPGDLVCAPIDDCHEAGTCDAQTGKCSTPAKPDNSPCSGGTCLAGTCIVDGSGGAGGAAGNGGSGGSAGAGGGGNAGNAGAGAGGGGEVGGASSSSSSSSGGQTPPAEDGCHCNAVGASSSESANWVVTLLMAMALRRKKTN